MPTRFNPLDYPLAMLPPRFLSDVPSWIGHIPFAFALIEMSRPKTIVELGTFMGDSYLAFCQAVAALELPSRCFAIDSWRGDSQTGFYDQQILHDLRAKHDPLYSGFSQLMQIEFDSGLAQFPEGSIDVLHIDGKHGYDNVKHDFETWLPKMSDAGLVLLHDTAIRAPGFGVWQLWEEVSPRYKNFRFDHSHGLGVLGVGRNLAAPVREFFESVSGDDDFKREEADVVRAHFAHLGHSVQQMQVLSAIARFMHIQQGAINDWKRRTGRPVDPSSEPVQAAFADCLKYAGNLTRDVKLIAGEA